METMDQWEIALLVLVAFLAISSLVRLMVRYRDELTQRFRQDLERTKKASPPAAEEAGPARKTRRAG